MALGRKSNVVVNDSNNITSLDEKREPHGDPPLETGVYGYDVEKTEQRGRKMSRLGGPSAIGITDTDEDSVVSVGKQVEMEASNAIKYRTCSWQKTAALLFSEYICLAIMSFPYSYSVLGLVPGLIVTIVVALFVLYTSLIVWEFCIRHPEIRDVCDLGQMLYYGWTWVWYGTAAMFLLNNTFIQGLHVLTGAKYLNTMTDGAICTIGFSAVVAVISWICSLPRTFDTLSKIATLSAFFTFISVLLAAIFAGLEDHPKGYNTGGPSGKLYGEPDVLIVAKTGTTFVSGMNAFLNISYTFIGQITLPSFIAEMKEPKDFPKALWAVTIAEIIVFSVVGATIYAFTGTKYNTAPAFGSLGNEVYLKVSFSFMIPTLIFLGVLYASVSARFIFFRIFEGTRHKGNHTVIGWASWGGILAVTWTVAFIIAEVIPFFSDLLSLMSSLFDSFFGFIFWGTAYMRMRQADYGPGWITKRGIRGIGGFALNVFIILIGLYMLTAGTYATVQSIVDNYHAGIFGGSFSSLHDLHVQYGGKMVPFGGFAMPVQYSDLSVGDSHKWTREKASLFDVGHMVQHRLSGPAASLLLEKITPSSITALEDYHSTLSCLLHPGTGGIVDDTVIARLGPETFYVVTNAACRDKDLAYLKEQIAELPNPKHIDWEVLDDWGLVALQGPLSAQILQRALVIAEATDLEQRDFDLQTLYFGQCKHFILKVPSSDCGPAPILVSRGGYTGEDGFEISMPPFMTQAFTEYLLKNAGPEKLRLAGLGARDSLRLEAGMCLYGHDLNDDITPVEGGLSWVVHKDRRIGGGFHGDEVILHQLRPVKEGGTGPSKRRVGLIIDGAPAREGAQIVKPDGGEEIGNVTSGCPSPTLGKNIAMGYVKNGMHKAGTEVGVVVRAYTHPPLRPRRLRRVLFLTSLSFASLSLGIYIASLPQITNFTALLRTPSTTSSLAYLPVTERATEINNLITNHPLSQRLRSDPEWTESRPHLGMPPAMRQHSLTASTLMGDTKIPVPPLMFAKGDKGEELVAISYLGADLCGHVGIIHGGMLATMLDEGLARCCFAALPSKVGVTARLEIDFRRPTKCEGFVVLKARTVKVEGRKAWVKGRVETLQMPEGGIREEGVREQKEEGSPYEEKGEVLVEAEGLFVEPKWMKVRSLVLKT
ncbi:MAG: hypothetical protein Q9209_006685 [Squamulea sp. 1 TL-2023]